MVTAVGAPARQTPGLMRPPEMPGLRCPSCPGGCFSHLPLSAQLSSRGENVCDGERGKTRGPPCHVPALRPAGAPGEPASVPTDRTGLLRCRTAAWTRQGGRPPCSCTAIVPDLWNISSVLFYSFTHLFIFIFIVESTTYGPPFPHRRPPAHPRPPLVFLLNLSAMNTLRLKASSIVLW